MKITTRFFAQDKDWQELLRKRPWNVFIHGGAQSEAEERCKTVLNHFSALGIDTIGINRQGNRHYAYQLHTIDGIQDFEGITEFKQALDQVLPIVPLHIMLDLTSLELDIILGLLPSLLEKNTASLFGLYLVPKSYGVSAEDRLELLTIAQPRGYVSFLPSLSYRHQNAAHFILLGFDLGRAQYFIDQYDWDNQQIHAVIGNPSYVPDGVQKAREANDSWLRQLPAANIHDIEAHLADKIGQFFQEQFQKYAVLDIIPLGPKPMLLGTLLFYLRLPEQDRARVRILYDFPKPRPGCTQGIDHGYLYDCSGLIPNA